MRISSQVDTTLQVSKSTLLTPKIEAPKTATDSNHSSNKQSVTTLEENKGMVTKEKLEEAVNSINEFLNTQQKSSKFIFHEGLDKYYVQLVDAETEEVIKEIPPEQLLNAFYEMKKLAGMIIDEKI